MGLVSPALGFGAFIMALVVSRILNERALRRLDTHEKGRLVEAFAKHRLVALIPLAAIGGLYFAMASFDGLDATTMLAVYIPGVLLFSTVFQWFVYRQMVALELDREYVKTYVLGRVLTLSAFGLLMLGTT